MSSKSLIIGAIVLVAILGLMLWGRPSAGANNALNQTNQSGNSSLAAAETFFDFGTITMKAGNVERSFEMKNPTDADVKIVSIVTSCMCTTAYLETPSGAKGPFGMPGHGGAATRISETIKPGESRVVKVVFDPNAHGPAGVGLMERVVMISDENGGTLQLQIKAMVTP
ncbi:MAG TPA: DUF1573 domain-containing protein [Candidatus Paceibacterota bacterium]